MEMVFTMNVFETLSAQAKPLQDHKNLLVQQELHALAIIPSKNACQLEIEHTLAAALMSLNVHKD